jgi:predicted RNA-binding protein YlqC (UPF0109 family)
MTEPKDFLEYMVKNIVDNPEGVSVVKTVDSTGVLLTLTVDPDDMGKVIGRQGATANALRSLVRASGMKTGDRVSVKISEPGDDTQESHELSSEE